LFLYAWKTSRRRSALHSFCAPRPIDPASKREVDKASAVIAKNEARDVLYFENEANFATYLRSNGT